jgi:hypothetical protein
MLVIHLYEAWLATLAIAIWHLYGTVFRPGVYPGNPSWVTGKMPKEMYEEEHPGEAGIQGVLAPAAKTEDGPVSEKDDSSSRLA